MNTKNAAFSGGKEENGARLKGIRWIVHLLCIIERVLDWDVVGIGWNLRVWLWGCKGTISEKNPGLFVIFSLVKRPL